MSLPLPPEQQKQLEQAKAIMESREVAVTMKIEANEMKLWITGREMEDMVPIVRESLKQGIIQVCNCLGIKVRLYQSDKDEWTIPEF